MPQWLRCFDRQDYMYQNPETQATWTAFAQPQSWLIMLSSSRFHRVVQLSSLILLKRVYELNTDQLLYDLVVNTEAKGHDRNQRSCRLWHPTTIHVKDAWQHLSNISTTNIYQLYILLYYRPTCKPRHLPNATSLSSRPCATRRRSSTLSRAYRHQ